MKRWRNPRPEPIPTVAEVAPIAKPKRAKRAPRPPRPPKPRPICAAGHEQLHSWTPVETCWQCSAEETRRMDAMDAAELRALYANPPAVMRMRIVDTGEVRTFAIPKSAWPKPRPGGARARRKRSARPI